MTPTTTTSNNNNFNISVTSIVGENSQLRLTPRETEVLNYVIQGLSAKKIARKINISHRTVEKYIENLKFKYNCATKSILIYKYMLSQK
jgi:DNA-binding CsgD family transcriptional regulator